MTPYEFLSKDESFLKRYAEGKEARSEYGLDILDFCPLTLVTTLNIELALFVSSP